MQGLQDGERIEVIIRQEERAADADFSLRRIIEAVLKGKWVILALTGLFAAVCLVFLIFAGARGGTAQLVLELNFPGMEKGLYPNGTKFEMEDIKAPAIIKKAMERIGLDGLGVDGVRRDILIDPVVPKEISQKALAAIKEGKDFVYYPNQFVIQFEGQALKLDRQTRKQLLDAVVSEYEADFRSRFSDQAILGNALAGVDYGKYDYPEISLVMHEQINQMKEFIHSKAAEAPDFRSKETGASFSDLADALDMLEAIELKRLDSLVNSLNLTKDKQKLITKYEYEIRMNELNYAKKQDEMKAALAMMEKFNQEQNSILVPGLSQGSDSLDSFKIGGSSYYDELAERAAKAGVEASNYLHNNEFLRSKIERLRNDAVPEEAKQAAEKDVLAMVESIAASLSRLVQKTNSTALEFFDTKLGQAIVRLSPVEDLGLNSTLYLLAAGLIGLLLGLAAVLLRQYLKPQRDSGEVISHKPAANDNSAFPSRGREAF